MGAFHDYRATITWTGAGTTGTSSYTAYSRDHTVEFPGLPALPASSDPAFRGDPSRYSPEQLFVASLSDCHMLWFLHLASSHGIVVREYTDEATGRMRVESSGAGQFVDVTLRPRVTVDAGPDVDDEALARVHELAHEHCFLARSVNFPVTVEPAPARIAQPQP
jgi:organic hydroperoxide reductase OsmC/OhrA